MDHLAEQALTAARSIRQSPGYLRLGTTERLEFDRNLLRIETALKGGLPNSGFQVGSTVATGAYGVADPYAVPLATPNDLRGPSSVLTPGQQPPWTGQPQQPTAVPATPPRQQPGTEVLGERARRALDAVDFPSFVAGLIQGTFQAIVDATARQVRDYARLVADISRTVDDFTRDNVSENQARDWLAARHPRDLTVVVPSPGEQRSPHVEPSGDGEESPEWLDDYGLAGEELTPELAEGPLLAAGRRALGEERMRTLATMVLMGINRIVVDDGQLRARLQFHARARESVTAEVVAQTGGQQSGIAARQLGAATAVSTMVSTVDVNAQADVAIKAELVGEVAIRFRTETFNLESFADAGQIALINRHSLTREGQAAATATPNALLSGAGAGAPSSQSAASPPTPTNGVSGGESR